MFLAFDRATNGLLDRLPDGSKEHLRGSFYTRQMISALSPSNDLMTNPAARKQLMDTQGESLLNGLDNLLTDLARGNGRRNPRHGMRRRAVPQGQLARLDAHRLG